jgi:hypothetical protein
MHVLLKIISVILSIAGVVLLIVALLAGIISLSALASRMRYGPGIMFADVEFFGLIALTCGVLGMPVIIAARKLAKWRH